VTLSRDRLIRWGDDIVHSAVTETADVTVAIAPPSGVRRPLDEYGSVVKKFVPGQEYRVRTLQRSGTITVRGPNGSVVARGSDQGRSGADTSSVMVTPPTTGIYTVDLDGQTVARFAVDEDFGPADGQLGSLSYGDSSTSTTSSPAESASQSTTSPTLTNSETTTSPSDGGGGEGPSAVVIAAALGIAALVARTRS
jgi:hypothetical protein